MRFLGAHFIFLNKEGEGGGGLQKTKAIVAFLNSNYSPKTASIDPNGLS